MVLIFELPTKKGLATHVTKDWHTLVLQCDSRKGTICEWRWSADHSEDYDTLIAKNNVWETWISR